MVISPTKMIEAGVRSDEHWNKLMSSMRNPVESAGDFNAQIAANQRGNDRLVNLIETMGVAEYQNALCSLGINWFQLLAECVPSFRNFPSSKLFNGYFPCTRCAISPLTEAKTTFCAGEEK